MSITTKPEDNKARRFSISWLFLISIILFVVFVRARLLDFPLERDEGEYAYMGQLILQGIPPYSEAYNMKFPGTYLMYALIMSIFGQTIQGIHLGLLILNCAAIFLVYSLGRKIISDFGGVIASGTYALLSLSSSVFGFAAHATHFVILPAMGGTLLLLHALKKEKLLPFFLSGALLGISFIMKQPGVFFFLFGATYLIYQQTSSRPANSVKAIFLKLGILSLGASLPLLITLFWLYATGVFPRFWFWTVVYASSYGSKIPFSEAFTVFRQQFPPVVDGFFLLWILSAIGFIAMLFYQGLKVTRVFVLLFTLFSFFSICPGFYFREHYFVTFLPAVSVLVGIFIDFLSSRSIGSFKPVVLKFMGVAIFAAAALVGIIYQSDYLFKDDPVKLSRTIYGSNPFPESLQIAEFIKSRSLETDKIAVLGSEPQIYFYSERASATGHIYTYGLMENHAYALAMQKEMAHQIEAVHPKFIVLVSVSTSWLARPGSEKFIYEWSENYIRRNYVLVGIADIASPEMTLYRWGFDTINYKVQSPYYILIFERQTK